MRSGSKPRVGGEPQRERQRAPLPIERTLGDVRSRTLRPRAWDRAVRASGARPGSSGGRRHVPLGERAGAVTICPRVRRSWRDWPRLAPAHTVQHRMAAGECTVLAACNAARRLGGCRQREAMMLGRAPKASSRRYANHRLHRTGRSRDAPFNVHISEVLRLYAVADGVESRREAFESPVDTMPLSRRRRDATTARSKAAKPDNGRAAQHDLRVLLLQFRPERAPRRRSTKALQPSGSTKASVLPASSAAFLACAGRRTRRGRR